jgi:hypothetical protein
MRNPRAWRVGLGILVPAVAVACAWLLIHYAERRREALYQGVLAQVGPQLTQAGVLKALPLSPALRHLTEDGTVDVIRTKDGRLIVFFKTSVGWKDNYTGEVYADAPFQAGDVLPFGGGVEQLRFDGWEEVPFIRSRVKDNWLKVYFDLN